MKFLIDAQLPPVLARVLVGAAHECEHVEQAGLLRADDRQIWDYAQRSGSIIVSKDEDFPKLKTFDPSGPAVVWLPRRQLLQSGAAPVVPAAAG